MSTSAATAIAVFVLASLAACATAGDDGGDPVPADARTTTRPDARVQPTPDAAPPIDAAPITNDAGQLFCGMSNANCTEPGTCCLLQFCVPGDGVGDDICVPD